eukprot:scaffold195_cov359-Prasinococcus_capsulatus_cf.AAC.15
MPYYGQQPLPASAPHPTMMAPPQQPLPPVHQPHILVPNQQQQHPQAQGFYAPPQQPQPQPQAHAHAQAQAQAGGSFFQPQQPAAGGFVLVAARRPAAEARPAMRTNERTHGRTADRAAARSGGRVLLLLVVVVVRAGGGLGAGGGSFLQPGGMGGAMLGAYHFLGNVQSNVTSNFLIRYVTGSEFQQYFGVTPDYVRDKLARVTVPFLIRVRARACVRACWRARAAATEAGGLLLALGAGAGLVVARAGAGHGLGAAVPAAERGRQRAGHVPAAHGGRHLHPALGAAQGPRGRLQAGLHAAQGSSTPQRARARARSLARSPRLTAHAAVGGVGGTGAGVRRLRHVGDRGRAVQARLQRHRHA